MTANLKESFQREVRYVVFKIGDLMRFALSDLGSLDRIGNQISAGRTAEGRPPFNAVVVEQDWPEFDVVWGMIEARMTGQRAPSTGFDLVAHLHRQREFSERTFGPGKRINGVTDHIAKELIEVRDSGGDLKEWIDVVILGLDGCWRSGATPDQIVEAIVAKQTKNEGRTWPDWRTVPADTAIEHDRSREAA